MSRPPTVRLAVADDRDALADLHRLVFPDYSSSRLGPGFSRRLIGRYLAEPDGLVLVVPGPSPSATPIGYLVACPPGTQRRVNDALAGWGAWAAAGQAIRSPRRTAATAGALLARGRRVATSLVRRARSAGADAPPRDDPIGAAGEVGPGGVGTRRGEPPADVRVVLVGVAPDARGRGVVDALLAAFALDASARGHGRADLLVAAGNTAAHRAYARAGWERAAPDRFALDLTPPAASA